MQPRPSQSLRACHPSAEEYAKTGVSKGRDMWIDLAWALINSPEFLLRH